MVPSTEHLANYLSHKLITASHVEWIFYNGTTCLAVICYVLKFRSKLSDVIRRLNDLASNRTKGHTSIDGMEEEISKLFVNSFVPEVQSFFNVPNVQQLLHEDESIKQNEILAAFLDFLLQVLNSEANIDSSKEQRYTVLQKELTYLLSFLGDIPLECTDIEEVKNLLTEFEIVVNEAGSIIYSCVFAIPPVSASSFDAREQALLEKVDLLNVLIQEHLSKFSVFPRCTTPSADVVDSMFIVDSLFEDLENVMKCQSNMNMEGLKNQIKSLHRELIFSRYFLQDIQLPHATGKNEVKESLIKLRDVAFEAEYLVNSHIVGNIPNWYLNLRLPAIVGRIKVIWTRLQETKKIQDRKVLEVAKDSKGEVSLRKTKPTVAEDNLVVGFEDSRTKILGDLVHGSEELKLISIFGMPGLGKTTIANKLYNDRSINDHFDLRAWCVVSQVYQRRNVLIDIFTSIERKPDENKIMKMEDEGLGLGIYQLLKGRRYIIIMDDVWNSNTWDDLRRYFPNDVNGSRILFTSRIKDSAPMNSIFHSLPLLSKSQCWDLLVKTIFHKEPCPPQLQDIGKCIAEKCNGLPLATVVIAGVLATLEKEESSWKKVERNLDSYILDNQSGCMKILEFSYEHLPNHLKLCFLYLGIFPEDTEIPTRKLSWMWIAEGFIKKEKKQSPEHVAEQYLLDLNNRSLLVISKMRSNGGIKACRVHDLLRDMCLRRAHEEMFLKSIKDYSSIYQKHYRLHVNSTTPTYYRPLGLHCRSFSGRLKDPSSRFPQMALLRVMDLLPTENVFYQIRRIFLLAHLRYLGVDRMPNSIVGNLCNLEFLCIKSRPNMGVYVKIPGVILKMVKLRHLQVTPGAEFEFEEECNVRCQIPNLESLSYVHIYDGDDEILGCLPHLRKLKCICRGTIFPDFASLTEIETMKLVFGGSVSSEWSHFKFSTTIKKLTLRLSGLTSEDMSILGRLPNLNVLKLLYDSVVADEWKTNDGEFQELRFLKLDSISVDQWVTESEHFPKLECLVLHRCWGAQLEIPSEIGNIPTLQRIEISGCSSRVNESAVSIEQEQRDYGNEELRVIFRDVFQK